MRQTFTILHVLRSNCDSYDLKDFEFANHQIVLLRLFRQIFKLARQGLSTEVNLDDLFAVHPELWT